MTDETRRADLFHWFDGETTEQLSNQIRSAGKGARLEVHKVGQKLWLHVIAAEESGIASRFFTPLNKSHECPPICP